MPWKEVKTMDLKEQLISDWNRGDSRISDLSGAYGISRQTVYKWINRYRQFGPMGLKELSRAPKTCPHKTSQDVIDMVTHEKRQKMARGARKIRAKLLQKNPNLSLPAISTISYWLKKSGLVLPRKKRRRVPPYTQPFKECNTANDVWSIDYKGQFYMSNKRVCYPLTVTDNLSRFILACKALPGPRYSPTRECLESLFRTNGLPIAIRSDNGTPFASCSLGGLSRLMLWFIRLGIIPERIAKGHPEQNGRHERMHRTLKHESSVGHNLSHQQEILDQFCDDFNYERPHEALSDQTPSQCYQRSKRVYVEEPKLPDYPMDYLVRKIRHMGEVRFKGRMFYVSGLLAGELVGFKQVTDSEWILKYSFYTLGTLDLKKNTIQRM